MQRETTMRGCYQSSMLSLAHHFGNQLQMRRRYRDGCLTVPATLRFNCARATGYFLQEFICHMGTCYQVNLVPELWLLN